MKTYSIPYENTEARAKAKGGGLRWQPTIKRWVGPEIQELIPFEKELSPHEIYHAGGHDEIGKDCNNFTIFLTRLRMALDKKIDTTMAIKGFYEVFKNSPIYFSLLNCYELFMAFYVATDGDTPGFWERKGDEIETIIAQRTIA